MQRQLARILTMAVFVGLGAAQGPTASRSPNRSLAPIDRVSIPPVERNLHPKPYQVGTASWYGEDFEGKPTASGEPYNMYDLTAAHMTLPLGTLVRVTNLRNRRVVVVRINDRGPVVPGRIIDVSYSAAKVLKFQAQGLQRVRLDVISASPQPTTLALLQIPVLRR
ncbi:MAG: septal ring lytic transglycosylase RlpA family protein [Acidobacteria bacterium]|nr:septal ring lytic transglycosylase RlpA family protein [Acidobacteriota bacterium]